MGGERILLITGASSGIGLATARRFDAAGDRVLAITRPGGSRLEGMWSNQLRQFSCDLARPQDISRLATQYLKGLEHIDVLFANAAVQPWHCTLTPEGLEGGFATGVLGTYLLIRDLLPLLERSREPSILLTGSMVHAWGQYHMPGFAHGEGFDANRSYYAVKLAQMQLVTYFSQLLQPHGIAVHALEPGMVRTQFARHFEGGYRLMARLWRPFMRSPEAVAGDVAALLQRSDLVTLSGSNWYRGQRRPLAPRATDRRAAGDLVEDLEGLCTDLGLAAA